MQKKEIKSGIYHQSMYINFVKHGVNALMKVYEEASVMQISEADNISRDLHNQASLLKCYLRFSLTFSYICFLLCIQGLLCEHWRVPEHIPSDVGVDGLVSALQTDWQPMLFIKEHFEICCR